MSRRTKAANAALTTAWAIPGASSWETPLLNEFTPDEIETVLAHELGHHVHKDIPVGMLVSTPDNSRWVIPGPRWFWIGG